MGIWIGAALFAALAATSADPPCATCVRQVSLDGPQAACLERRLVSYLEAPRGPILVSVAKCSGADNGRRLEIPQILPSLPSRSAKPPPATTYLISRPDAVCLLNQLKVRSPQAKRFDIDLSMCP